MLRMQGMPVYGKTHSRPLTHETDKDTNDKTVTVTPGLEKSQVGRAMLTGLFDLQGLHDFSIFQLD